MVAKTRKSEPVTAIAGPETDRINETLQGLSRDIYGADMELRYVDPNAVAPIDKNARYMEHDTFLRLVDNLKRDGRLESVPLCVERADGVLEAVSGNHRVLAAQKAGLAGVLVLVLKGEMSSSNKRAKQLSHNEIVGQDDPVILRELWIEIDNIQDQIYSGLDSLKIGELDKIDFSALSTPSLKTEAITLWFLPEEVEEVEALVDASMRFVSSKKLYLCPLITYEELFDLLVDVKKRHEIKNTAVAFMHIVRVAQQAMELIEGEMPYEGNLQEALRAGVPESEE